MLQLFIDYEHQLNDHMSSENCTMAPKSIYTDTQHQRLCLTVKQARCAVLLHAQHIHILCSFINQSDQHIDAHKQPLKETIFNLLHLKQYNHNHIAPLIREKSGVSIRKVDIDLTNNPIYLQTINKKSTTLPKFFSSEEFNHKDANQFICDHRLYPSSIQLKFPSIRVSAMDRLQLMVVVFFIEVDLWSPLRLHHGELMVQKSSVTCVFSMACDQQQMWLSLFRSPDEGESLTQI